MKRLARKERKISKGMPSAVVLSIAIHVGLFLLAGMLVVFTVVKKEDKKFVPPKAVERPKMKLRKPKVKVKKSAKPKSTTRIVTKIDRASMPDIQLPEMSGMSAGLEGGIGGFDMMPDLGEVTVFGEGQSIGNDFVGTFYDFKRDRSGRSIPMEPDALRQALKEFVRSGWKTSDLARYYRSPKKLYTTCFAIPEVTSELAPDAFGEAGTKGWCWAAHYKGQLVFPEDITFRFWGMGDDLMLVRVDSRVVLVSSWPGGSTEAFFENIWSSTSPDTLKYALGINVSVVGDWITLEAGVPLEMEVLFSEVFGGSFQAMLVVEVKGEEYPKNPFRGGPTLPVFKTSELSLDLVEAIHGDLDPGDASVTNGPVFRDYNPSIPIEAKAAKVESPAMTNVVPDEVDGSGLRTWTSTDGRTMEAEFKVVIGGQAVLENSTGKQQKIPLEKLSAADRAFIEFENPPRFDINFSKKSTQIPPQPDSPFRGNQDRLPLRMADFTFGANLKQEVARSYSHWLRVEYFAFAEEVEGDNYVLLDRQESSFIPSPENKGSFSFHSKEPVRVQSSALWATRPMRGTKYGGYLITVTDERGKIIQYKTSHKWLFESLENLKRVPLGKHFNKEGNRIGPPRPGLSDRPEWYFK